MNRNVETFIGCDNQYDQSDLVIFGAPFDSTTSFRPGTRFASKAIRSESFGIETYSPYQQRDLEDYMIFDGGDLELVFGNTTRALEQISEYVKQLVVDGKRPCMIGGEHLVSLGAISVLAKQYPQLHIVHFDAHTDLREDYLGEPLSHATVMRRAWELLGDGRIYQFGIRSGERAEWQWAKDHVLTHPFDFHGLDQAIAQLQGKPVYFSIDLDILDPSIFPGTGTPEAGGVMWSQLVEAIIKVGGQLNIVGMDINELAPIYDQSGSSTAVACKTLRELLLAVQKPQ